MDHRQADCLIVGAGPAGLVAAIYLARFRRNVLLIDKGHSRCSLIPRSNNVPGFRDGVSGVELLDHLREQARRFGVSVETSSVERLESCPAGLLAHCRNGEIVDAATVILATGIVDHHPELPGWRDAVAKGDLRYCPVCDAYEAIGSSMAVIGSGKQTARKAVFLRTYSSDVSALLAGPGESWSESDRRFLTEAGVRMHPAPVVRLTKGDDVLTAAMADGRELSFDVVYPAMGADVGSDLATRIGADHDDAGFLKVDGSQQTTVRGLYAVGDVVSDLHQISVAFGHAAVAACHIHNSLPKNLCSQ